VSVPGLALQFQRFQATMSNRLLPLLALIGLSLLGWWYFSLGPGPGESSQSAAAGVDLGAIGADRNAARASDPRQGTVELGSESVETTARQSTPAEPSSTAAVERCRLTGRLIDGLGRPLQGQLVTLFAEHGWPEAAQARPLAAENNWPGFETRSDVAGHFRFEVLPPFGRAGLTAGADPLMTRVQVRFSDPPVGNNRGILGQISLKAGERELGDLVLLSASAIEGRLLNHKGEPIAGGLIESALGPIDLLGFQCRSAMDGAFLLGSLPLQRTGLRASAPGFLSAFVEPLDLQAGQRHGPVEVRLEAGASLAGRVRAVGGPGLEGVRIDLFPSGGGALLQFRSGSDGYFEATLQQSSEHKLLVSHPGYFSRDPQSGLAVVPGQIVEIELEPLPVTEFFVVDGQSGAALESFSIEVFPGMSGYFGAAPGQAPASAVVTTHPGGRVLLGAMEGDQVRVCAPGYTPIKAMVSWESPEARICRLRLQATAQLLGQARIVGSPATQISWTLSSTHGDYSAAGLCDAEGHFRVQDLAAGRYRLQLAGGGLVLGRQDLLLLAGQVLDLGALELAPGGSLRVRLIPPRSQTAAGLPVYLHNTRTGPSATTDAQGEAHFAALPPGQVSLHFPGVAQRFDPAVPIKAEIQAGQETTVEIDLTPLELARLEVQLVAHRLGTASVKLGLWERPAEDLANGPMVAPVEPDAQGRWVGYASPRGSASLVAQVEVNPSWSWIGAELEVLPGGLLQETFELPAAELWLNWQEDDGWPSELILDLDLSAIETRARQGSEPLQHLASQLRFDWSRPGPLTGSTARLEAPGRLRWSALPPGRFGGTIRLLSAADRRVLREQTVEWSLTADGLTEWTLR
jgi:hypothetical protein